jgi:broad specificity phosphatase PhoE
LISIWLARHGETDWNASGRWMGQEDVPLNARGREQAREIELPSGTALVASSPLVRAAETASIVAGGLEVRLDRRLAESDRGEWTGLTAEQMQERDPELWAAWLAGAPAFRFPGGESIAEHLKRTRQALAELPQNTLVVCHGGTIRCAFMQDRYPHDLPVPNGRVLKLDAH